MDSLLIIVSGPPLTGKSTLINALQLAYSDQLVIVCTDDIRQELYGSYEFLSHREPEIWDITFRRINEALTRNRVVILDATLRFPALRLSIRQRFNNFPVFYIVFDKVPVDVLLKRNQKRVNKQFTPDTIRRLYEEYELPNEEELSHYSHHTFIQSDNREQAIQETIRIVAPYIDK